ncbi:hypothetical protein GCM10009527_001820 [Actinomadura nitritigenes]
MGPAVGRFDVGSSGVDDGCGEATPYVGGIIRGVCVAVGCGDAPRRPRGGAPGSGFRVGDADGRAGGVAAGISGTDGEAGGAIGCGFAAGPPPGHRNSAIVTSTAAVTAAARVGNAHRQRVRRSGAAARPASWNRRTVPGSAVMWSAAAR